MTITVLIENTSACAMPTEHGLSMHVALEDGRNVLFDMGQTDLLLKNAHALGIDLGRVDLAVLSHGHYDHGGGLGAFLGANVHAPVYVHDKAFRPHYSLRADGMRYIGMDTALHGSPRLVFCGDGPGEIVPSLTLFGGVCGSHPIPPGNMFLFGPSEAERDAFADEQNLIIREGKNIVLLAGCAHAGISNIMGRATEICGTPPTHVLAGMHLSKNGLAPEQEQEYIESLASHLLSFPGTQYYTMHCTGVEQYERLSQLMGRRICYLSCGESLHIH